MGDVMEEIKLDKVVKICESINVQSLPFKFVDRFIIETSDGDTVSMPIEKFKEVMKQQNTSGKIYIKNINKYKLNYKKIKETMEKESTDIMSVLEK